MALTNRFFVPLSELEQLEKRLLEEQLDLWLTDNGGDVYISAIKPHEGQLKDGTVQYAEQPMKSCTGTGDVFISSLSPHGPLVPAGVKNADRHVEDGYYKVQQCDNFSPQPFAGQWLSAETFVQIWSELWVTESASSDLAHWDPAGTGAGVMLELICVREDSIDRLACLLWEAVGCMPLPENDVQNANDLRITLREYTSQVELAYATNIGRSGGQVAQGRPMRYGLELSLMECKDEIEQKMMYGMMYEDEGEYEHGWEGDNIDGIEEDVELEEGEIMDLTEDEYEPVEEADIMDSTQGAVEHEGAVEYMDESEDEYYDRPVLISGHLTTKSVGHEVEDIEID